MKFIKLLIFLIFSSFLFGMCNSKNIQCEFESTEFWCGDDEECCNFGCMKKGGKI